MDNIKAFDTYASYIFDKLYKHFPICANFEPKEEISEIEVSPNLKEIERIKLFSATLVWLEKNGFISITSSIPKDRTTAVVEYYSFFCVELTVKGLNLLTSPTPKAINKTKRLGEEIVEKVKKGAYTEAGREIVEAMLDLISKKGLE